MKYKLLRFPQGKTKAVTFSYDDGCREDLKTVEVLNKYGLKATFNIHSGCIATESGGWTMTEEEIRDSIVASGHEIAVHGYWHKAPGLTRTIEGIKDVLDNRLDLEKRFGGIIRGMAYPDSGILDFVNGSGFQEVKNYLKELDIAYARTLGGDNNRFHTCAPKDPHCFSRLRPGRIFHSGHSHKDQVLFCQSPVCFQGKRQRPQCLCGHFPNLTKNPLSVRGCHGQNSPLMPNPVAACQQSLRRSLCVHHIVP